MFYPTHQIHPQLSRPDRITPRELSCNNIPQATQPCGAVPGSWKTSIGGGSPVAAVGVLKAGGEGWGKKKLPVFLTLCREHPFTLFPIRLSFHIPSVSIDGDRVLLRRTKMGMILMTCFRPLSHQWRIIFFSIITPIPTSPSIYLTPCSVGIIRSCCSTVLSASFTKGKDRHRGCLGAVWSSNTSTSTKSSINGHEDLYHSLSQSYE